jgi:hypothetical protein
VLGAGEQQRLVLVWGLQASCGARQLEAWRQLAELVELVVGKHG